MITLALAPLFVLAETREERAQMKHEIRIGWGDMLFETAVFHDSPSHQWRNPGAIDPAYTVVDKHDHRYTGHLFAEYQYRVLSWLGVGVQVDFEGIFWKETSRDAAGLPLDQTIDSRNYNLLILPTVRFTYLHHKWVNLYSGISVGFNTAFDNTGAVEIAPALNLNLFGLCVGRNHWFGSFEVGLLNSLISQQKIYMVGSRLMAVSVGYRL